MKKAIVYRRISFVDLEECGYSIGLLKNNDATLIDPLNSTEGIFEAIYTLGVMNNHYLEIQGPNTHRRLTGERANSYSIVGEERNDKEWLKSGWASDERKMTSSKMGDMLEAATMLGRGGI